MSKITKINGIIFPTVMKVGEDEIEIKPITPAFTVKASQYIRERRLREFWTFNRNQPMTDDMRAATISRLVSSVVTDEEVLDSPEGRYYIAWLSIKHNPKYGNFDTFIDQCKEPDLRNIVQYILLITGFLTIRKDGEQEANPTITTSDSSQTTE